MQPETSDPPHHLTLLLGFIIAIGPVSVDMYLPAFPLISNEFSMATPQLTLASYFFGFAAGQMAQGLLSDRFGRRLPLAAGLLLYTLASLGCALAHSGLSLCWFRALAAFGAAASIVVPRAMVRDFADGDRASALMSEIYQVMSVAPVIAPVLGSLVLLTAPSWRVIFVVAALYGVAGLFLLYRYLPESLPPERRLSASIPATWRLYADIIQEPGFVSNTLVGTYGMCALFAYLAGAPTVFMVQHQMPQWQFGVILAVLGAATIGFYRLNKYLVTKLGTPRVITLGVAIWLSAAICLMLLAWTPDSGVVPVFLGLLLFGFGYSFIPGNAQVGALSHHRSHAGTATALMSTMQYCAGGVAGALVGKLANGTAMPMASIMLVCALGAATAAWLRPRTVMHTS
ncbi:MAG TPA: multidrug effflux MFS transporter [Acidocella sp.]|nr:multidrug effflux MFS transporter [Acidocella sp.]